MRTRYTALLSLLPGFFFFFSISFLVPAPAQAWQGATPQPATEAKGSEQAAGLQKKEVRGYTLSPEKYWQAVAFNRARYRLYFAGFVYGVLVYLLVLRWRVGPKYRDWAERASFRRFVQVIVYVPLLVLTLGVANLPRFLYGQWLLRAFGLSVQGWGSWAWDWVKAELIIVVFGAVLVWILYGVIRRSPRRWWFYFWLAVLPIIVFVILIEPWVVDPLFFEYEPLGAHHPALVAEIEKLVARAGIHIPPECMYEMKASEKYNAVNAYVTGIGASKRVVVWDTTLAKMTVPQTLSTFGHELGHYVLGHISEGIAFAAVGLLVALFLGYRLVYWALRRWGATWAIRGVDDWGSLPVLLLLLSVLNFAATPIGNAFSRHLEHEADLYGLEVTHGIVPNSGEVAAQDLQIGGEINLQDPDPPAFIRFWLYTHPPVNERIIFARTYDPWSKGQAPKLVK